MKKYLILMLLSFYINNAYSNVIYRIDPKSYSNSLSVVSNNSTPQVPQTPNPPETLPSPVRFGGYSGTGTSSVYGYHNPSAESFAKASDGDISTTTNAFWIFGLNSLISASWIPKTGETLIGKTYNVKFDLASNGYAQRAEVYVILYESDLNGANLTEKIIYRNLNEPFSALYSSPNWLQKDATVVGTPGKKLNSISFKIKGLTSGYNFYFRVREITVS